MMDHTDGQYTDSEHMTAFPRIIVHYTRHNGIIMFFHILNLLHTYMYNAHNLYNLQNRMFHYISGSDIKIWF